MYFEHQGKSLWYGTPDAPAPRGAVQAGGGISITLGVKPADVSNAVEVLYQVDHGSIETVMAKRLRKDFARQVDYFIAHLPAFQAGYTVEYTATCRCAKRQVPSPEEAKQFTSSFRVTRAEAGRTSGLASKETPFAQPIGGMRSHGGAGLPVEAVLQPAAPLAEPPEGLAPEAYITEPGPRDESAIGRKYRALGGPRGILGPPSGPERTLSATVQVRDFTNGTIVNSELGTFAIWGPIWTRWKQLGREGWAYPASDTKKTSDGVGAIADFQTLSPGVYPKSICWAPEFGAFQVYGAIRARWMALGRETWAYPVTDEHSAAWDARRSDFARRQEPEVRGAITWTPSDGAHEVSGTLFLRWEALGAEAWGQPTTGPLTAKDHFGRFQNFRSPLQSWPLPYPRPTDGRADGAVTRPLSAGSVGAIWARSDDDPAFSVTERILATWLELGDIASFLGYPIGEALPQGDTTVQAFEHGSMIVSRTDVRPRVQLHADGAAIWPTPVLLTAGISYGSEEGKPFMFTAGLNFNEDESGRATWITKRMVLPTPRVRFGPFRARFFFFDHRSPPEPPPPMFSAHFRARVYARSPIARGLFVDDAANVPPSEGRYRYIGAATSFTLIGEQEIVLQRNDIVATRDFFVETTLPSAFTALYLEAAIWIFGGPVSSATFPAIGPTNVPPRTDTPGELPSLDADYLQGAVNPLAIVAPQVAPLAILYAPPGSRSWTKLTETVIAGSKIDIKTESTTSTRTLKDVSLLSFQFEHEDFTETKTNELERGSQITVADTRSYTTQRFLPDGQPRPNAGLGHDDLFILEGDPAVVYWDTADLGNFVFAGEYIPGTTLPRQFPISADDLRAGILPQGVTLTPAQRNQLLALDPFTGPLETIVEGGYRRPKLPDRFVRLHDEVQTADRGRPFGWERVVAVLAVQNVRNKVAQQKQRGDGLGLPLKLLVGAANYAIGAALTGLGSAALKWAASEWPDRKTTFDDLAKKVKDASLPDFIKASDDTAVTMSFTASQSVQLTRGDVTGQIFYVLQHESDFINFEIWYDAFFGTYVLVPVERV